MDRNRSLRPSDIGTEGNTQPVHSLQPGNCFPNGMNFGRSIAPDLLRAYLNHGQLINAKPQQFSTCFSEPDSGKSTTRSLVQHFHSCPPRLYASKNNLKKTSRRISDAAVMEPAELKDSEGVRVAIQGCVSSSILAKATRLLELIKVPGPRSFGRNLRERENVVQGARMGRC